MKTSIEVSLRTNSRGIVISKMFGNFLSPGIPLKTLCFSNALGSTMNVPLNPNLGVIFLCV
jgi:hypothetical protein